MNRSYSHYLKPILLFKVIFLILYLMFLCFSLAYSVTLFCSLAVVAILIILSRRSKWVGGELGGPKTIKYFTSCLLVSLWLFYVIMSTLEVYDVIEGF